MHEGTAMFIDQRTIFRKAQLMRLFEEVCRSLDIPPGRQGSESRLTRFGTEDCLHVGAVPPCHFPAQLEAHCLRFGAWFGPSFQGRSRRGWHVGSGPDEVEGEMAHDGHVVGAVPQND